VPLGLPLAFTEPVAHPLESLVARYARTHGPFTAVDVAGRFACSVERIAGALAALEADDRIVRGEFRPNGVGREYCDADVLRQLRRRSLATCGARSNPSSPPPTPASCKRGTASLANGVASTRSSRRSANCRARPWWRRRWSPNCCPPRCALSAADLDELCTTGDVVWVGAGALGPSDGRIRLYFADSSVRSTPRSTASSPVGPLHQAIRTHLATHGASFWNQLRGASSDASDAELLTALWDLVWAGEVTNDSLAPLRAVLSVAPSARWPRPAAGRVRAG
jgi:ATP-dependent Lhr-like helicase